MKAACFASLAVSIALVFAADPASGQAPPESCRDYLALDETARRTVVGTQIWLYLHTDLNDPQTPLAVNRAGSFIGLAGGIVSICDLHCAARQDAPFGGVALEVLETTEERVKALLGR